MECVSGGCPTGTYQDTPVGSQTEKGHGGPCAFWDLQNAPGGWGPALVVTFRSKSSPFNLNARERGLPLIPNYNSHTIGVVDSTAEPAAYDHPKKDACQYVVYIEDVGDAGNNVYHPDPGDDSFLKMTRKADGSIQIVLKFPGAAPWTGGKTLGTSIFNHWLSGKTYNTSTSSWEDHGSEGPSGSSYAANGGEYTVNVKTDISSSYKGCCGPVYGGTTTTSVNLGGSSGSTTGGAAH